MFKKFLFISLLLFLPSIVKAEEKVYLKVPYTSQIPNGRWVSPWNAACEEASIIMIEQFYLGRTNNKIPNKEAQELIKPLFAWEDKIFGENKDSNAIRTAQLINDFSSFKATIKEYPTLDEIKEELRNNRPVLSLHYGRGLNNPRLHFRPEGSSYHMIVIIGFDDTTQEFITHDPGFTTGLDARYSYATILDTLHDFNHETKQADGPPVVIFTEPKILAKISGNPGVYLVEEGVKFPIAHSGIFNQRRWSWKAVKRVTQEWLDSFPTGELIK